MGYMYFHLFKRCAGCPLPRTTRNCQMRGFTLLEVMVVVAILGVLAALAGPSFGPLIERWRVRQAVESMTSTLYYARSEAIRRGGSVVIEKIPKTTPGCTLADTAEEWGCGWFVFVDTSGNGKWSAGEEILRSVTTPPNTDVIHKPSGTSIKIDRYGMMGGLNTQSFIFSPASTGISSPATRAICTASGGRIKAIEAASCPL